MSGTQPLLCRRKTWTSSRISEARSSPLEGRMEPAWDREPHVRRPEQTPPPHDEGVPTRPRVHAHLKAGPAVDIGVEDVEGIAFGCRCGVLLSPVWFLCVLGFPRRLRFPSWPETCSMTATACTCASVETSRRWDAPHDVAGHPLQTVWSLCFQSISFLSPHESVVLGTSGEGPGVAGCHRLGIL